MMIPPRRPPDLGQRQRHRAAPPQARCAKAIIGPPSLISKLLFITPAATAKRLTPLIFRSELTSSTLLIPRSRPITRPGPIPAPKRLPAPPHSLIDRPSQISIKKRGGSGLRTGSGADTAALLWRRFPPTRRHATLKTRLA